MPATAPAIVPVLLPRVLPLEDWSGGTRVDEGNVDEEDVKVVLTVDAGAEDGGEEIGGGVSKDEIGDGGGADGSESEPVSVPDSGDDGALGAAVLVSVSVPVLVLVLTSAPCACLVVVVLALCEVGGGGTAMIVRSRRGRCQWNTDYYEAAVSRRSC